MAKQGRGAGGAAKIAPKVVLKGSAVLADRLVFSADGRVLMVSGEMLESHAWDLATGKPLMSETIGDAMADLANMAGDIQKRLESASPDELAGGDFSSIVAAAMGGKAPKGGGGAMADIMNMELGGLS